MKKTRFLFLTIILSAVVACSTFSNKSIDVSMMDTAGHIKLDRILLGKENTKVMMEITDGKPFRIFAPGTNNCYFFMDPLTKKEYKLLSGEGIKFNETVTGPIKFTLTFERLDNGIKLIHLIGGKEALVPGRTMVGFYDINLEK